MVARTRRRKHSQGRYSSRLTSKYQATVPREIRRHLRLKSGDQVVYELLADNTVIIRKTTPLDIDYHRAISSTMNEWESEEDERAYKDL